jgi:hypothetical protein
MRIYRGDTASGSKRLLYYIHNNTIGEGTSKRSIILKNGSSERCRNTKSVRHFVFHANQ